MRHRQRRRIGKYSRKKKSASSVFQMPSLNSLLDVVMIVLVYLIKTFAVNPITVQSPSVDLPISSSREAVEKAVVVMLTGNQRIESVGKDVQIIPDIPTITVGQKVLLEVNPKNYSVSKKYLEHGIIKPLMDELLEIKNDQIRTGDLTGEEGFSGDIILVADKEVTYNLLKQVMKTCYKSGYKNFSLAIAKKDNSQ